ncbi:MAG: response regulator [Nitrospira sp. BO4]|jgi:PAS domain S-box-containing protein|nr:response regulator [Nitrospira sp. BO4]
MQDRPFDPQNISFLAGGGEMGARMRAFDFSTTPLGPVSAWPQSLRSAVSICLNSRFPIVLYWGKEFVSLYNDAYISIWGEKHPWALGKPFEVAWADIWDALGPVLKGVMETGIPSWSDDQLLVMQRHGYVEETYFTFSFGAGRNEQGEVAGIFCAVAETTQRVLHERRLAVLRELTGAAKSPQEAATLAAQILDGQADIPFALVYLLEQEGRTARLAAHTGIPSNSCAAPPVVDIATDDAGAWPLALAITAGAPTIVTDLARRFAPLPGRPWPEPAHTAIVWPLQKSGQSESAGLLILGVSPRRRLNESYQRYFELVAGHVATMLANGRAYEDEKNRAEALAEIDRAKTAFFSNVSHELRTPLTLMLGPLEDLKARFGRSTSSLDASQYQQIDLVHRNGLRLLKLVNTLLDFSRIEAGRAQVVYEETELAAFTTDLASVFRSTIEKAGLSLIVDCPPLPEPVFVDRDMWEKIVLNLLSNAFKFTFSGEIEIALRPSGKHVELSIRDTGTGIPDDQLGKIFERFHRVSGSQGRTHEGTGIGLALVQELAQLHGGSVSVDSAYGKGSTFRVFIPLGKSHLPYKHIGAARGKTSTAMGATPFVEEAARWLPSEEVSESGSQNAELSIGSDFSHSSLTARSRVLLADDNADMREYVSRLLRSRFEVQTVADGQAALDAARANPPEVVLTDIMMPRLDGFGLLRALRDDPATKTIPVILLSARAGEESRVEGLEQGADDYLIKPFSARELLARVETHVKMARMRRQAMALLHESEVRFRNFADTAPAMLWVTESDGACSFLSRVWYEYTGQTEAEGLGVGWLKAVHPDDRKESGRIFLDAIRRHVPFTLDYRLRRADGEYRWCIDTGRPRFDDQGTFLGYVGSVMDITERKLVEEEFHRLNNELETRVRERTQELWTSQERLRALATELNLTEQRERKRVAAELHDHLQQTLVLGKLKVGQGKRVAAGIPAVAKILDETDAVFSDALQYTRTLVAELSPPVLRDNGLVAGLKWLGESMREKHGIAVTVTMSDDSRLRLPEDQTLLMFQSVRELLINSWKYAGTGAVAVSLEHSDGVLRITVSDNGPGFDLAAALAGTSSGAVSSKFGLFSIRERMKALGGSFEVHSGAGQGTKATLVLPLIYKDIEGRPVLNAQASRKELIGQQKYAHDSARHEGPSIRVLLVDDHKMVRQGLRTILEGYADINVVGEAINGEEAVALVDQLYPDVVVMDLNMPKMNGIEATRLIKASHTQVQIVGLSVNMDGEAHAAVTVAGAHALLTKEAAADQLYDAIHQAHMTLNKT